MYGSPVSKDLKVPAQQRPAVGSVRTSSSQQMSSPGLLRYRSAPSTLLGEGCGDFRPASPDHAADAVLTRFLVGQQPEMRDKPPRLSAAVANHFVPEDAASMASQQQQLMYQSQQQQQQQQQQQMAAMEGLYRSVSSGGTESTAGAGNSPLRQSSSPAGFLNHLAMDNGYGNMLRAGMGGAVGGGFRNGGETRLKGQLSFSSRQGSVMSQILEVGSEELNGSSPEAGSNGAASRRYGSGIPGYPMGSSGWDEPSPKSLLPSSLQSGSTKRPRDAAAPDSLVEKFSLPAANSSIKPPSSAAIDKFLHLQFQDAVPCKIRAKRGCATHPRSIAERVRRTRISERIRKLQELVPSMEKQSNTADMLDLAVDYIKELQKQIKVLDDGRASCTCSASNKQIKQHFAG
ncbi:hypothetical protein GUJ93_ZPchr0009g1815 [Zizania palustris]|uniref:BHLH domain-containing protein n=1 Tax=Zizania palustris TaxID=103762 RepID=A0A8J5S2B5_ZIZPA|nr:hypothetical protein GUJ93_ZPchr0009g1815 [Zizania palustris]